METNRHQHTSSTDTSTPPQQTPTHLLNRHQHTTSTDTSTPPKHTLHTSSTDTSTPPQQTPAHLLNRRSKHQHTSATDTSTHPQKTPAHLISRHQHTSSIDTRKLPQQTLAHFLNRHQHTSSTDTSTHPQQIPAHFLNRHQHTSSTSKTRRLDYGGAACERGRCFEQATTHVRTCTQLRTMVYLTTLSVGQTIDKMIIWIKNWKRMWKEAVVAWFKVLCLAYSWRDWRKLKKTSARILVAGSWFEPGNSLKLITKTGLHLSGGGGATNLTK
jgi:hypothetical protein